MSYTSWSSGGAGNNNNQDGSPSQGGGDKRNRYSNQPAAENRPCRPVTIHQIYSSNSAVTDAQPIIDGKEIDKVTIVGRITSIQSLQRATANAKEYTITDGTGQIIIKDWQNAAVNADDLHIGSWVSATGTVKNVGNSYTIIGSPSPMEDQNELIYHFLEACLTHARLNGGDMADQKLNDQLKNPDLAARAEFVPGFAGGLRRDRNNGIIPIAVPDGRDAASSSPDGKKSAVGVEQCVNVAYKVLSAKQTGDTFSFQEFFDAIKTNTGNLDERVAQAALNKVIGESLAINHGNGQYAKG